MLVEQVICCKLVDGQRQVYADFVKRMGHEVALKLSSQSTDKLSFSSLGSITHLKKLCNREFDIFNYYDYFFFKID